MSVFPVFNAFVGGLFLLSLFTWNCLLLLVAFFCGFCSILLYIWENLGLGAHFVSGFWLFIFSEIMVFGSLLFCCLYFDYSYYTNLSSPLELPFLGCFILLGSSLTVTSYHHLITWNWGWVPLLLTIVLGIMFVCLQLIELDEIVMNLFDTTFHASSLCTVGLHFSHVLLGVIGLLIIFLLGFELLGYYWCSVIVWYWHFVDYVWLFVYTFVYIC